MATAIDWPVVALDPRRHDRRGFTCGDDNLDEYLQRLATQDLRRNLARVFVIGPTASGEIAGYYALNAASHDRNSLPAEHARRLPGYPVPAAILGRLAVALSWQGRGLGERLLIDALRRVSSAATDLAVQSIIVDAKDAGAAKFYSRYGFLPFTNRPLRLFLPLARVGPLFG